MQVGSKPLSQLKAGQEVRVVVLPQTHHFLLSMRQSAITAAELSADPSEFTKAVMKPLAVGEELAGAVDEAMDDHLYVVTANDVRVRVHCLHASDDPGALACLPEKLPVGSVVRGRLLEVETERKHVSMSLLPEGFAPLCKGGPSPKVSHFLFHSVSIKCSGEDVYDPAVAECTFFSLVSAQAVPWQFCAAFTVAILVCPKRCKF